MAIRVLYHSGVPGIQIGLTAAGNTLEEHLRHGAAEKVSLCAQILNGTVELTDIDISVYATGGTATRAGGRLKK